MGERFSDDDTRAAKQAKFNQAVQKKDEKMEDWADRVQELAAKAFDKLPDDYCRSQAVQKFCEDLLDCEAGHHVIMQEPSALEQAVKRTRLFQHTKGSCYKQKPGGSRTPRVTAEDYDKVPEVCAVAEQPNMSAILKEMAEQRQMLAKLLLQDKSTQPQRRPRNSKPQRDHSKLVCNSCNQMGHIVRNCPERTEQDLNKAGTGQGATARTQEKGGPDKKSDSK